MKKKSTKTTALRSALSADEYRLFHNQPRAVLRSYAVARKSMMVIIPAVAVLALINVFLAAGVSLAIGIAEFLLLVRRYGVKGALTPFLCAAAGIAIGVFLLAPIITHVLSIRRVLYGL